MTRTRGLIVSRLDSTTLMAEVRAAHPGKYLRSTLDGPLYLIDTPRCTAVIGTEGVGHVAMSDGTVRVLLDLSGGAGYIEGVPVPIDRVRLAETADRVDLADVVRTFGDRLERNFSLWYERAAVTTGRTR